jgi:hypothetical protein
MNRAMLERMVLPTTGWPFLPGTALIAVVDHLADASAAVTAGADLVDLGVAPPEVIAAFRARHPGVLVCAAGGQADVVRDPAVAKATGAWLICENLTVAANSGIPADRVLVDVLPATLSLVVQAGLAALVDADRAAELAAGAAPPDHDQAGRDPGEHSPGEHSPGEHSPADSGRRPADSGVPALAGIVAIAAVSSWLGAAAVRTRYPLQVRRGLDMAASIRGIRPPVRAVRGLA